MHSLTTIYAIVGENVIRPSLPTFNSALACGQSTIDSRRLSVSVYSSLPQPR
jgi:hypothetical protein